MKNKIFKLFKRNSHVRTNIKTNRIVALLPQTVIEIENSEKVIVET